MNLFIGLQIQIEARWRCVICHQPIPTCFTEVIFG